MEESVVADFVGRIHTPDIGTAEPVSGRVLLSQRRLVLATNDDRTTVPLAKVFDIAVGTVPSGLTSFFSDTVTIAYDDGRGRRTAVVEGESDHMERFTTVLFKALLRNVSVTVRHPAKVGGRVTDAPEGTAAIRLAPGEIGFVDCPEPFTVDLSTVTDYNRTTRTLGGQSRPALVFRHVPRTQALTSIATVPDKRTLNVLGRYIKLEYGEVLAEVEELDPTNEQLEILVSIYSAGGEASISDIVTGEAARTNMVLDSLREQELVVDGDEGTVLTRKGQMVVSSYMESVNG
ncbi:chemotaxis protein CheF2 [Halorubrum gandharaense]